MTEPTPSPSPPGPVSVAGSGPVAIGGDVSITGAIAAGRDVVIERLSVIADDWAPAGDGATRPGAASDVCPYPGIQPFAGDQREWFVGRDRDRRTAAEHLERSDFLAVIGGSGSGKSSLLVAGIGPDFVDARRELGEDWTVRYLRPGSEPATLFHRLLESDSSPTLWLVDQLEEAFARRVADGERRAFLDRLGDLAAGHHGRAKVVVALRSDFYAALDVHRGIADAVAAEQQRLLPLDAESMREVIVRPAELVGLRVEPALVEQILADLDPGANQLPLLAYAMRETWRRRRNGWLTLAGYVDAGGVGQALENGARSVWDTLTPEQRETARRVFLRLTSTGEGRAATRQRVVVGDLATDRDHLDAVVDVLEQFTRQRLVVPDRDDEGRPTVDIAHEALLREWSVLRSWLDDDLDARRLQRQLSDAAREWDDGGREPTGLLAGRRLQAVREGRRAGDITVNDVESAFLQAAERRESRDRRRSVLLVVLPLILVAAAVAVGSVTLQQRRTAAEKVVADALQLSAQARGLIDGRRDQGTLMAVAAWQSDANPTTLGTLIDSVSSSAGPLAYPVVAGTVTALAPAFAYDGTAIVGLGDGSVRLIDPVTGQERVRFEAGLRSVSDIAVAADGTIVAGGTFGEVAIVPGGRGEARRLTGATSQIEAVRFDPGSQIVIAGARDGTLWRWRLDGDSIEALPPLDLEARLISLELVAPVGVDVMAVVATEAGSLQRVDLSTGTLLAPLESAFDVDVDVGVSLASTNQGLLVRSSTGIDVWDVAAGRELTGSDEFSQATSLAVVVGPSPPAGASSAAFTGSPSGSLQAWTLEPHPIPVGQARKGLGAAVVAVATDGVTAVGLDVEHRLVLWDVGGRRSPAGSVVVERDTEANAVAISSQGAIASGGGSAGAVAVTTANGTTRTYPGLAAGVTSLVWRDPTTLVVGSDDGAVRAFDIETATTTELAPAGGSAVVDLVADDDGDTLAFATQQGDVTVIADGRPSRILVAPDAPITSLALASDGAALAVGIDARDSSAVFVWDLDADDDDPISLLGHTLAVTSIAFSPDGRLLATGSDDRTIRLWAMPSGDATGVLEGHTDLVAALAFSADGRQLVSGGEDYTMRVWDVDARAQLGEPWRWTDATVYDIAVAPDGSWLVAANGPTVVRWALGVDGWIAAACSLAGRDLTDEEWADLAPNHEPTTLCLAD